MKMKLLNIAQMLDMELPKIIIQIARENNISEYVKNPDFKDIRLNEWHQYGLLTHTRKVRQAFLFELNPLLINWGLYPAIERYLSKDINGIDKKELFEASIIIHDLGKIVCLHERGENIKHEVASAELVDEEFLKDKLTKYGLNRKQLDYLKTCVKTHDVFGRQIRNELKESGKLNLEYLAEKEVRKICQNLALKYSDVGLEIGLFFICDSLGKLNGKLYSENEREIIKQLKKNGLPLDLKSGILQHPINMELSRVYLNELFN